MESYTESMDVDVSLGFPHEPHYVDDPLSILGGIKILVGGNWLTKYRNHEKINDQGAEYIGDHILPNLRMISLKTAGLLTGSYEGTYVGEKKDGSERPDLQEHRISLEATRTYLILSGLDGKHIRVAFQDDREGEPLTYLRDNLGYAVDGNEFGEEIVGCIQQFFSYARKCDVDESEMPRLKKNMDRLGEITD